MYRHERVAARGDGSRGCRTSQPRGAAKAPLAAEEGCRGGWERSSDARLSSEPLSENGRGRGAVPAPQRRRRASGLRGGRARLGAQDAVPGVVARRCASRSLDAPHRDGCWPIGRRARVQVGCARRATPPRRALTASRPPPCRGPARGVPPRRRRRDPPHLRRPRPRRRADARRRRARARPGRARCGGPADAPPRTAPAARQGRRRGQGRQERAAARGRGLLRDLVTPRRAHT
jgi:hypothetical protein